MMTNDKRGSQPQNEGYAKVKQGERINELYPLTPPCRVEFENFVTSHLECYLLPEKSVITQGELFVCSQLHPFIEVDRVTVCKQRQPQQRERVYVNYLNLWNVSLCVWCNPYLGQRLLPYCCKSTTPTPSYDTGVPIPWITFISVRW